MSCLLDDDVADIDADAELDPLVLRHLGVALDHAAVDFHRAAYSIDNASELDQQPITCRLDDAAVMLRDLRVDQLAPMRLQRRQRADLVGAHQTAVSGDIGGQDGGKPSLDAAIVQWRPEWTRLWAPSCLRQSLYLKSPVHGEEIDVPVPRYMLGLRRGLDP